MNKKIVTGLAGIAMIAIGLAFANPLSMDNVNCLVFNQGNHADVSEDEEKEEHAGAAQYLASRRGNVSSEEMHQIYREVDAVGNYQPLYKADKTMEWQEMGPDNTGGRTYEIVVDKDDNKTLYAGAASGGVFKSVTSGSTWKRAGNKDNPVENHIVRCMIQTSTGDIYYGTGEYTYPTRGGTSGNGNSGAIGRGVYKSTDKAETFSILKATDPASPLTKSSAWDFVYALASPSTDGNKVFAATEGGIYVTTDAGQTWKPVSKANTSIPGYSKCAELKITPDGTTLYAVMQPSGSPLAGVIRSTDGGDNWARIGFATGKRQINDKVARMEIAISPSDPKILYLSAANQNFLLDSIYRSEDGGDNWKAIVKGGNTFIDPFIQRPGGASAQGDYDNCIIVDPINPDRIFVGGVNVFAGVKSGSTFKWNPIAGLNYDDQDKNFYYNRFYVHADKHCFAVDTRTNPYTLYIGTDGGIFKTTQASTEPNPIWSEVVKGFITTQFYAIDVDPNDWSRMMGGTQDNSNLMVNSSGFTKQTGTSLSGGDGGYAAYSKIEPRAYIVESQYGGAVRSLTGKDFTSIFSDSLRTIVSGDASRAPFVTAFRLWETLDTITFTDPITGFVTKELDKTSSKFIIAPNSGLYLTRDIISFDRTPQYFKITKSGGNFNTMEFTPDGNYLFVADGNRLRLIKGLENYKKFKKDTLGKFIPDSFGIRDSQIYSTNTPILGIGVNPKNPNHVVITCGIYGSNIARVFVSRNALSASPTFVNVTKNLPGIPVYDAEINGDDDRHILLATETGFYSSYDIQGAGTWREDNKGFQRVPVFMLKQMYFKDRTGPVFYGASHGRGLFRSSVYSVVGIEDNTAVSNTNATFSVFPNPMVQTGNVQLKLNTAENITLSLYDLKGKLVKQVSLGRQPEGNTVHQIDVQGLTQGTYILNARGTTFNKTSKILIGN